MSITSRITDTNTTSPALKLALRSNQVAFLAAGFSIASWAPVIPFVQERFLLDENSLGLLLLVVGLGSLAASPLAGFLTSRLGCKKPIFGACLVWFICMILISFTSNMYVMLATLFVFGLVAVTLEVVSNINGALIEQRFNTAIMSGLHARYSLGGLAGSFGVTAILSFNLGLLVTILLTSASLLLLVLIRGQHLFDSCAATPLGFANEEKGCGDKSRDDKSGSSCLAKSCSNKSGKAKEFKEDGHCFKTDGSCSDKPETSKKLEEDGDLIKDETLRDKKEKKDGALVNDDSLRLKKEEKDAQSFKDGALEQSTKANVGHNHGSMWQSRYVLHPAILMVSYMLFVLYLTEGAMLDWSAVFLVSERGMSLDQSGLGYAAFALAMTICRFLGDYAVGLIGRKRIIVLGTLLICLGFSLSCFSDSVGSSILCFVIIGVGSSNVIPQLVSYVAKVKDVPMHISVTLVNSLGFTGVLLGPAIIGFIAAHITLPYAFLSLGVLVLSVTALSVVLLRRR